MNASHITSKHVSKARAIKFYMRVGVFEYKCVRMYIEGELEVLMYP